MHLDHTSLHVSDLGRRLALAAGVLVALYLTAACGRTGHTRAEDSGGGSPDTAVDSGGPRDLSRDAARDSWSLDLDDQGSEAPGLLDGNPTPDGDLASHGDLAPDGQTEPDLLRPDGPQISGPCAHAPELRLVNGVVRVEGDLKKASTPFPSLQCAQRVLKGQQALYRFRPQKGRWYRFELRLLSPEAFAVLSLFTNPACSKSAIEADCASAGTKGDALETRSFEGGALYFEATSSDALFVHIGATEVITRGRYELTVTELTLPKNTTCAKATWLNITSSKTTVRGDLHPSFSPSEFPLLRCGYQALKGPQAYYSFDARAGDLLRIEATTVAGSRVYAYVAGSVCSAKTLAADCNSNGITGAFLGLGGVFRVNKSGRFTLAVIGHRNRPSRFTLEVERVTPAPNGRCAQATPLTFDATGVARFRGDLAGSSSEFGGKVKCGYSNSPKATQAYYSFPAKPNTLYSLSCSAPAPLSTYVFRSASCGDPAQMSADCGSKGSTGEGGYLTAWSFQPQKIEAYTLAVSNLQPTRFACTLRERDQPANARCQAAESLTFAQGKAETSGVGDVLGARHYGFRAEPGTMYRIAIDLASHHGKLYAFRKTSCGGLPSARKADWDSKGIAGDVREVRYASRASFFFEPAFPGDYVIAVDAVGPFSLTVEEAKPPSNHRCSAAALLPFVQSKTSVVGHTSPGSDEFGASVSCGKSKPYNGPQVYYRFFATAGLDYRLHVQSPGAAALYLFNDTCDPTLIEQACSTPGWLKSPISLSGSEHIWRAPTTGIYRLAIDSRPPEKTSASDFELTIDEETSASNKTCATAEHLTLSNGKAEVRAFLRGGPDEFAPGTITCVPPYASGQVYYTVDLKAGVEYALKVTGTVKAYYFRSAASCQPAAMSADCSSHLAHRGGVLVEGSATLVPKSSQRYTIVVDWLSTALSELFTLSVVSRPLPTLQVPASGLELDFETSGGGLASTGDWQWGQLSWKGGYCGTPPALDQGHAPAQKGMWATVLDGCLETGANDQGTCLTGSTVRADDSVLSFNLALPASWTRATLEWWEHIDLSKGRAEVWVDDVFDEATQVCHAVQQSTTWRRRTIDLSAHVGDTVHVAFHLMNARWGSGAGWYIDALAVKGQ